VSARATRLYPLPAREIPADAIYDDLELPPAGRRRDPSRPYVIINMVASVDGKAGVGGKAAPLGSEVDRRTMRNLRSRADAVMIGAGTLRAEKLSLGLDEPSPGPQPLAIIVTSSGDVPLESNLVPAEQQEVLLLLPEGLATRRHAGRQVLPVRADGSGSIDFGEALRTLKDERGVDLLLVEGGPTLNHALISENLADELFLTLAPRLIGGPSGGILLETPLPNSPNLDLLGAHVAENEIFLRYKLGR
jgi:2,5-diamino-6-(ribosylamino)-4(3H)-pyrimidinone 5'-phosphate reductase